MKTYAISLDLTVQAVDDKHLTMIKGNLKRAVNAYNGVECGNISPADLLCDNCKENIDEEETMEADGKTLCYQCYNKN